MQVHVSQTFLHRTTAAGSFQHPAADCLRQDSRPGPGSARRPARGGSQGHRRGLQDCYTLNPKAPKASVFAGWKDMDAYMRENKIEGAPSVLGKVEKPERTERSSDIETEPRDPAASRNRS